MTTSSARVLVLSPDESIIDVATSALAALGHKPLVAHTASDAQRTLSRTPVELICTDSAVRADEFERVLRWLTTSLRKPSPPVLLMAPRSASASRLPSFYRRQRDGLATKPLDRRAFSGEVARMLAEIVVPEPEAFLRVGEACLDRPNQRLLFGDDCKIDLTPTELRLLTALMAEPGEFIHTETLLETVWSIPAGTGGAEIVRSHVSNIRRKLRKAGESPDLVRTAPQQGYAFIADEIPAR